MSTELTLYRDLLGEIKTRVGNAQRKAAISANAEMILMYWEIGRMIAARQQQEGWGAGVIARLAVDLKNELPEIKGFSERNIGYMIRFAREYGAPANLQQPAANLPILPSVFLGIPWFHNVILIQKIKDLPTRLWYAGQVLEHGWSREMLTTQIKNRLHERQGGAVTNFATTLPEIHANLAQGLLKDPYLFDFLTLEEPFHERELETGLLTHIQKFLIDIHKPIGVADYELTRALPESLSSSLPSIEAIEAELSTELSKEGL